MYSRLRRTCAWLLPLPDGAMEMVKGVAADRGARIVEAATQAHVRKGTERSAVEQEEGRHRHQGQRLHEF